MRPDLGCWELLRAVRGPDRTCAGWRSAGPGHEADVIVVAAGLGSARLLGDDETVVPIRGEVVRVRNPGLTDWLLDDDHPAGMTYVVPRRDDVVCGGTAQIGNTDLSWDPADEEQILRRAIEVVPALAGQPIVSRGVGLRPSRPQLGSSGSTAGRCR